MAQTEYQKLERAYEKAKYALIKKRDELYPVGTDGVCTLSGYGCRIISGSLYPDQINTSIGHMSARYFQLRKESK